jgi:hypothetical protein
MQPRPSRFARRARKEVIRNKAVQPVEDAKQELAIVHLGGPWYQVGDGKYKGRAAAEEALHLLIEGTAP